MAISSGLKHLGQTRPGRGFLAWLCIASLFGALMAPIVLAPAQAGATEATSVTAAAASALAAATNNTYVKNVFEAGSTTPASQVAPGDSVTYVLDLGANNTQPTGTAGTIKLNDQLAAGHTAIGTPTLPSGWTTPVAPVAGAASPGTTIGTFDIASNTPTAATNGAPVTMKPNLTGNSWDGAVTLATPSTTLPGGGGDGMYAFTYTNGVGQRQFLAVNHAGSNIPCFNYPSYRPCVSPSQTVTGNYSIVGGGNIVQAGNRLYFPVDIRGTGVKLGCLDVSATAPTACAYSSTQTLSSPQGVVVNGNWVYAWGNDLTAVAPNRVKVVGWNTATSPPTATTWHLSGPQDTYLSWSKSGASQMSGVE